MLNLYGYKRIAYSLLIIWILFPSLASAQGFKIKELKLNMVDLSASTQPREDEHGRAGGLIKIQTNISDLSFEGNVIGNVDWNLNEYWVYLSAGTTQLNITRSNYLPMVLNLSDYGIESISTKATYIMQLKEESLDEEICGALLHIKPYDAIVMIDSICLKRNEDGNYRIVLPKGEHICNISATGYETSNCILKTGKTLQTVEIALESLFADLSITCMSNTTEIIVDSISKGFEKWTGQLLPGPHTIEARRAGHRTITRHILLKAKEQQRMVIPNLQPMTADIEITTNPKGCHVFLDNTECAMTPCRIEDVMCGQHTIIINLDSCGLKREIIREITISDEHPIRLNFNIVDEKKLQQHKQAFEWFKTGRLLDTHGGAGDIQHCQNDYYDKIMEMYDHLEPSFFNEWVTIPEFKHGIGRGLRHDAPYQHIGECLYYFYDNTHLGSFHELNSAQMAKRTKNFANMASILGGVKCIQAARQLHSASQYEDAISLLLKGMEGSTLAKEKYYPLLVDCYYQIGNVHAAEKYLDDYFKLIDSIDNEAFSGCTGLTSIVIPKNIKSIGLLAFQNCHNLASVTISDGVTNIGRGAFSGCSSLKFLNIGNNVKSIGSRAFDETPWLENQPQGIVYVGKVAYKYKGEMPANTKITLKEGAKGIAEDAFSYCKGLMAIIFPNTLTDIGESAFSGCSNMNSIIFSNNISYIGKGAFSGTHWLDNQSDGVIYAGPFVYVYKGEMSRNTRITLNDGIRGISPYAFYNCVGLSSINIPNSVLSIGKSAFQDCSNLNSISIGNSVTSIGRDAFNGCEKLTSVTIPNSVVSIGSYAFPSCI